MERSSEYTSFTLKDTQTFKRKAIYWANLFDTFCLFDNNKDRHNKYHTFEWLLAADALQILESHHFDQLEQFKKNKDVFGYFAYDLKNEIEDLRSQNIDQLNNPLLYFFEARYILKIVGNELQINRNYPEAFYIFDLINKIEINTYKQQHLRLKSKVNKEKYIENVKKIKDHIVAGDIYEMNYCIEYYSENVNFNTLDSFNHINEKTKSPFSCFLKFKNYEVLCFSPERFLKKQSNKLIAQPIKGTIGKSSNKKENEKLKNKLKNDIKERAENVMIVDLMRNDLSKSGQVGRIQVEELFEIYEFETINQMISTIVAQTREGISTTDIIKNTFPMGSMTGAPKIRAMQIIEDIEIQKRSLYSGAIGYFTKTNDFDFNVVIRTIIYNSASKYLSLQVGGAITYDSTPENEWQETKVKIKAIMEEL